MDIEYDYEKSKRNLEKHGISFGEAEQLWNSFSVEEAARSEKEPRWLRIGKIKEKIYTCVFTRRGHVIRLISLRRSRKKEENIYYEEASKEKDDHGKSI